MVFLVVMAIIKTGKDDYDNPINLLSNMRSYWTNSLV